MEILRQKDTLVNNPIGHIQVSEARRWSNKISFGDKLPLFSGLYAIYYDDKLVYIGKSLNIRSRVKSREFLYISKVYPEIKVYVRYLPLREKMLKQVAGKWCEYDLLTKTETRYISILKPPLNLSITKNTDNFLKPQKSRPPFYKKTN